MQEPLAEPPEGVLSGEDVPHESEPEEYERNTIDRIVGVLKSREQYHGRPDDELREIAREKFRQ